MKIKQLFFAAIFSLSVFSSCQKEPVEKGPNPFTAFDNGVFILNEGYDDNTGSISFWNSAVNKVEQNVFSGRNGRQLGHFIQSMTFVDSTAYIVVNGNNKIEVVKKSNFKSIGTISGLSSPRYMVPVSPNKAYVSQWYTGKANNIAIVDLQNNSITKKISSGASTPDMMVLANNKLFVGNVGYYNVNDYKFYYDSTLTVIDVATDSIIKTFTLGYQVKELVLDKNKNVWVITNGNQDYGDPTKDTQGKLFKINTSSLKIDAEFTLGNIGEHPSNLILNPALDQLYFQIGYNGIYTMNINDSALPTAAFISKSFYRIAIDHHSNTLLATDPKDYTTNGSVIRFNLSTGAPIDTFQVGIIPGAIYNN